MSELVPVLTGCRVLVTAQRRADELSSALARRGAAVDRAPVLSVVAGVDEALLMARTKELLADPPDVVVVTTAIGFRSWLEAAETNALIEPLVEVLRGSRLVARGPKARGALQAAGLVADWVAESETSREIVDFLLTDGVEGVRIAVQHHGNLDESMDRAFVDAGADVVALQVYRWGPSPDPAAVSRSVAALGEGDYDAVLFTSAPGAAAWLRALEAGGVVDVVRERSIAGDLMLAAVGPVTAEPLAYAGFLARQPSRARMGALVRLVIEELGNDWRALATCQGQLRVRAGGATLDHRPLPVAPSGLAVLRRLATSPGRVVSREDLLRVLPDGSDDLHRVEVAVARLRESLRAGGGDGRIVRTVVKRGYLLAGEH